MATVWASRLLLAGLLLFINVLWQQELQSCVGHRSLHHAVPVAFFLWYGRSRSKAHVQKQFEINLIDICGHIAWEINNKTKHKNNHTNVKCRSPARCAFRHPAFRHPAEKQSKSKRGMALWCIGVQRKTSLEGTALEDVNFHRRAPFESA